MILTVEADSAIMCCNVLLFDPDLFSDVWPQVGTADAFESFVLLGRSLHARVAEHVHPLQVDLETLQAASSFQLPHRALMQEAGPQIRVVAERMAKINAEGIHLTPNRVASRVAQSVNPCSANHAEIEFWSVCQPRGT